MKKKKLKKDLKVRNLHTSKDEYASMKLFALCILCFWGGLITGLVL